MSKKQENTKKEKVEAPEMKRASNETVNSSVSNAQAEEPNFKDLYLRTLADMDNLRKNTNKRISEIYQSANEKIIYEMLSYLDSLNLAVEHEACRLDTDEYNDGFEALQSQFKSILSRFGVKEIEILAVEPFDDSKMNAIMTMATKDKNLHNKVCDVTKKGYMLYDKVLRYADVVVYNYSE